MKVKEKSQYVVLKLNIQKTKIMASGPIASWQIDGEAQQIGVGVNSGSWWWTARTGMLWFMGSQRVGHDWAMELNWHFLIWQQF